PIDPAAHLAEDSHDAPNQYAAPAASPLRARRGCAARVLGGVRRRAGRAAALARGGLRAAVRSLTRPTQRTLQGPAPTLQSGQPIAPYDVWGNDVLWWPDRIGRRRAPLIERMTLG